MQHGRSQTNMKLSSDKYKENNQNIQPINTKQKQRNLSLDAFSCFAKTARIFNKCIEDHLT